MDKNVGGIDRTGRIVIGVLVLVGGGASLAGIWELGLVAGAVGCSSAVSCSRPGRHRSVR